MDFISLTSYQNRELGREAHRMFLGGDRPILLIEDMDLSKIMNSPKSISCIPLLINGLDGSPVTIIASI
jgi:kynurenine formamidase